jgi:hypothetical protein
MKYGDLNRFGLQSGPPPTFIILWRIILWFLTFHINANTAKSITNLWQQYSPTAWSEMYNEYVKYTIRMTEIYQEYAKSSERMTELYKELAINAEKMTELYKESAKNTEKMTKYWLNYFSWMKPLSEEP